MRRKRGKREGTKVTAEVAKDLTRSRSDSTRRRILGGVTAQPERQPVSVEVQSAARHQSKQEIDHLRLRWYETETRKHEGNPDLTAQYHSCVV